MSNPDLPGPYWRDDAGYGSQRRGGLGRYEPEETPWDNERFWRDDRRDSRPADRGQADNGRSRSGEYRAGNGQNGNGQNGNGRSGQYGNGQNGNGRSGQDGNGRSGQNGHGRNGQNGHGRSGRAASGQPMDDGLTANGRGRRAAARDEGSSWQDAPARGRRRDGRRGEQQPDVGDREGLAGRFSQTADDLRNRLGLRGSVLGRGRRSSPGPAGDEDQDRQRQRGGRRAAAAELGAVSGADYRNGNGHGSNGYADDGYADGGYAGNGQAADTSHTTGHRRNGHRGNGRGELGQDDYDRAGSRTGLRERPRDDWAEEGAGRRGPRSRLTDRQDALPGRRRAGAGGGSGDGRGGGHGGDFDGEQRSRGERFKHWLLSGSWWRHWTWKKALAVLGGGIAAFILLGIAGFFALYLMTPIPTDQTASTEWQSSSVYFSDGKLLGTFSLNDVNRQLLDSNQIPQVMDNALVAAEDRNFYTDDGVSIKGLLRSAYEDATGGTANLQGGSTITMQYAKQHYSSLSSIATTQSVSYKVKEIMVALKLSHQKSAQWILTQYLNTVFFGDGAYGVGAAAQQYFNINLAQPKATLTVPQAAMLAALPNEPSNLSPYPTAGDGYAALVDRWEYVIGGMQKDGAITAQQESAICGTCDFTNTGQLPQAEKDFSREVKITTAGQNLGNSGYRYYLTQMVKSELETEYGLSAQTIDTSGLKITTTFNQSMIAGLNRAVGVEESQMKADGRKLPNWAHVGAALIDPKNGGILAIYGGPGIGVKNCNAVACWNNNAEVPHQPGSSFKPYVLATAVSQGMNAQSSILNGFSPICVPPQANATDRAQLSQIMSQAACAAKGPLGFWPATDTNYKAISPAEAAAVSSNTAFEDLAHKVGIDNIINMAGNLGVGSADEFNADLVNDLTSEQKAFGDNGQHPGSVTLSLGASGADLTAIEQASTFATLAADGVYHTPHVIASITGGKLPNGNVPTWPSKVETRQALSPSQAADVDYALSFDNTPTYAADGATGYPAAAWDRPVIGKTGTTNTAQDAWFIGAIPQFSLAVTLYTNQQNSVSTPGAQSLNVLPTLSGSIFDTGGYGGVWPATIWHQFMSTQFAGASVQQLPPTNFELPFYVPWNQAPKMKAKKPVCQPGGPFQNCQCKKKFGQQQCGPNPNPTGSCGQPFAPPCGGPSPSPSPTNCGQGPGPGQPCTSPSPSPSPSSTCTQGFGQPPCNQGHAAGGGGQQSTKPKRAASAAQPAEEALSAITDAIRTVAASRGG